MIQTGSRKALGNGEKTKVSYRIGYVRFVGQVTTGSLSECLGASNSMVKGQSVANVHCRPWNIYMDDFSHNLLFHLPIFMVLFILFFKEGRSRQKVRRRHDIVRGNAPAAIIIVRSESLPYWEKIFLQTDRLSSVITSFAYLSQFLTAKGHFALKSTEVLANNRWLQFTQVSQSAAAIKQLLVFRHGGNMSGVEEAFSIAAEIHYSRRGNPQPWPWN